MSALLIQNPNLGRLRDIGDVPSDPLNGKKLNVNDLPADIELEQITKERHANNGNGSEGEICWC